MGARFIEQEHDLRSDQIICMAPPRGLEPRTDRLQDTLKFLIGLDYIIFR